MAKDIQEAIKKAGGVTRITTKFTTSNKETKIILNSAWVKEHCLFKDKSLYKKKEDYGRMMEQLTSYTVAGKNKHDDACDSLAMLVEFLDTRGRTVTVMRRPF